MGCGVPQPSHPPTRPSAIDGSLAQPKNRRLTHDRFVAICELRRAGLGEAAWEERYERLTWFVNALLEMSVRTAAPGDPASVAGIDGRGRHRRARPSPATTDESPGGAGTRRPRSSPTPSIPTPTGTPGTSPTPDAESGPSQSSMWGFEASLVVTGADSDDEPEAFPSLCHRHGAVAQAQPRSGRQRHPCAREHPRPGSSGEVSGRGPGLHRGQGGELPAPSPKALGYRVVLDYKRTQLGIQDSYHGMVAHRGRLVLPLYPRGAHHRHHRLRRRAIDEPTYRARSGRALAVPGSSPSPAPTTVATCGSGVRLRTLTRWHAAHELKSTSVRPATQGRLRIPSRPTWPPTDRRSAPSSRSPSRPRTGRSMSRSSRTEVTVEARTTTAAQRHRGVQRLCQGRQSSMRSMIPSAVESMEWLPRASLWRCSCGGQPAQDPHLPGRAVRTEGRKAATALVPVGEPGTWTHGCQTRRHVDPQVDAGPSPKKRVVPR